jgi:rhamnose utilization protein RhaD (predicted bifunctional aldolase and dehydrogenase)
VKDFQESLIDLEDLSFWIGVQADLVQGPGGNTSYKNEQEMWVKASGTQLRDAKTRDIFARVSQQPPFNQIGPTTLKPSIEVFLHRNCPTKYVAHTHSVGAMALSFRTDAQSIISNLSEIMQMSLVPYGRPGMELERNISKHVDYTDHEAAILVNHGLLVWGESAKEVKSKIKKIEKALRDWKILGFGSENEFNRNQLRKINGKFLTPDHAVFLEDTMELEKPEKSDADWITDFIDALRASLKLIPSNVAINFIPDEEVFELQKWESEIARKRANS